MREAFISILALLAILAPAKGSDIGKDGFNFYKEGIANGDYLRGRSDEALAEEPVLGDRTLYFYRTPVQVYPGLMPVLEQEYRKRTGNAFKNHMLSKEMWTDGETPKKRTSKTALSLMMQSKQPYYTAESPLEYNMEPSK